MRVSLISALATNRVIGKNNALPWRLPPDLKHFRALTRGHAVIMGRRTWESLGRPLPERLNIVISRNLSLRPEGAVRAESLDAALNIASGEASPNREECFIIGGAEIYRLALPLADCLHLTWIHREVDGDAWFPEWDTGEFRETARESHPEQEGAPAYSFTIYDRARPSAS